jgi:hypothetical protein
MKKLSFLAMGVLLAHTLAAQSEINLFYIDSSQPLTDDFMRQYEIEYFENAVQAVKDETGLFLYHCNGERSLFARNQEQRQKVFDALYGGSGYSTSWESDKTRLREYMYPLVKSYTGSFKMHLFLSDEKAWQVEQGEASVVKLLPKELYAISGMGFVNVEVFLYFDNESNRVDEKKLRSVLEFYNTPDFAPVITYHIETLKSK